jgi:abequosyltransferase
MSSPNSPPRLSVCVPTHHGRGPKLDQLLELLAAEPDREQIEVCVSDNASRDGTAEIIARHRARFGGRLRYHRNERDLGWGENLLGAVELARGDYCWLMGSDDAPAPGSISRLLELIGEHDGTSGIHLGHLRVTPDLQRMGTPVAPESYPAERVTTRMQSAEEVALASYLTLFLSNNVVHRARWQQVADSERSGMGDFPLVPHMYMMGRMAAAHPDWVWCPELLVISREGDIFLREPGEIGTDTRIVRQLIGELDRLWGVLHGRRSYVHRSLLFKALRQMCTHEALLSLRASVSNIREQIALLSLTRHFWWSRSYWFDCLPALVVPVAPLRYASGAPRLGASRRVAAHDRNVDVSGGPPGEVFAGYATWIRVRVVNRCSRALSSAGPFAAVLACRWEDPRSGHVVHSGSPTKLWPPLAPNSSRMVELSLAPPPLPGDYRLVIAPVEQYDGWYDQDQSASGASVMVNVRPLPGRQPGEIVDSVSARTVAMPEQAGETAETLPGLTAMTREVEEADGPWRASRLAEQDDERILRALISDGFEEARLVAGDCSIDPTAPTVRDLLAAAGEWVRSPRVGILSAGAEAAPVSFGEDRVRRIAPVVARRLNALYVAMMWDVAGRRLGARLEELEEPAGRRGLIVSHRGRSISQSLAASALALSTLAGAVPIDRLASGRAIQLGGGDGGLAWTMLSLHAGARCVLVDRPPALALAQRYLSETLPGRRAFHFRRFSDPAGVLDELLSSEIAFLTPNQLAQLPPLDADLWLSVGSLRALTPKQLLANLQQADRHVSGWAYSKQPIISVNPADGFAVEQAEYPYPARWRRVLERPDPLQRDLFEAIFELPPTADRLI